MRKQAERLLADRSAHLPALEYPGHFLVKKITTGGTFRFHRKLLHLATALVDQSVGLEETPTASGRSTSTPC